MTLPSLHISVQTDASILSDFFCGQNEMDNFLHTRLGAFLKSYPMSRFYVVKDEDGTIVAMFVLSSGHLYLDEDCKDDLEMKYPELEQLEFLSDYWESGVFPTIEIDYLAVRKEFRGKHIGDALIHFVSAQREDPMFHAPLFISVSAYSTSEYTAVPFYQKCAFWPAEIKNPFADTLRMYRMFD